MEKEIKIIRKTPMLDVRDAFIEEKPALFKLSLPEKSYILKYEEGPVLLVNNCIITSIGTTPLSHDLKNATLYFRKQTDSKIAIWKKIGCLDAKTIGTKLILGHHNLNQK